MLGRRLRLAVIGGGPGSFIGAMHRPRPVDDRYEIVAGVLSSDPERSRAAPSPSGSSLPAHTDAPNARERADRADGVDVVAIMTPNDSHHDTQSRRCSRIRCHLRQADHQHARRSPRGALRSAERDRTGLLPHPQLHGYPMVRQARAWWTPANSATSNWSRSSTCRAARRPNAIPTRAAVDSGALAVRPVRGGPSLVMGDIGTHAHNLVQVRHRLEVTEVAAEVGRIVANRLVDDFAGALLRFDNGATRIVLGDPGRRRRRELPALAGVGHPGDPRVDAGQPTQSQLPTHRRAGPGPDAERSRHRSPLVDTGQPHRGGPSRGLPRGIRQHLFRRRRGDRGPRGRRRPTRWPPTSRMRSTV